MAPEQFQGKVSPRSDQYSLGIIAYTLLTGQRPFNAPPGDMFAWGWQHYSQAPTPPTHHNPRIPAHIEQAILKALAKDREQRYSTVALFVEALRTLAKTKGEWLNEGNALRNLKRYEEALQAYDRALRLNPNYAYAYNNKGLVLQQLGREKEAQQMFEKARQLGYKG